MGVGSIWEISVSSQFSCEPKTVLKNKVLIIIKDSPEEKWFQDVQKHERPMGIVLINFP